MRGRYLIFLRVTIVLLFDSYCCSWQKSHLIHMQSCKTCGNKLQGKGKGPNAASPTSQGKKRKRDDGRQRDPERQQKQEGSGSGASDEVGSPDAQACCAVAGLASVAAEAGHTLACRTAS